MNFYSISSKKFSERMLSNSNFENLGTVGLFSPIFETGLFLRFFLHFKAFEELGGGVLKFEDDEISPTSAISSSPVF